LARDPAAGDGAVLDLLRHSATTLATEANAVSGGGIKAEHGTSGRRGAKIHTVRFFQAHPAALLPEAGGVDAAASQDAE